MGAMALTTCTPYGHCDITNISKRAGVSTTFFTLEDGWQAEATATAKNGRSFLCMAG
jgi:hypothetical protein